MGSDFEKCVPGAGLYGNVGLVDKRSCLRGFNLQRGKWGVMSLSMSIAV